MNKLRIPVNNIIYIPVGGIIPSVSGCREALVTEQLHAQVGIDVKLDICNVGKAVIYQFFDTLPNSGVHW